MFQDTLRQKFLKPLRNRYRKGNGRFGRCKMNEVELTVDIIIENVSHIQGNPPNVYYYLHTIAGKNFLFGKPTYSLSNHLSGGYA